MLRTTGEPGRTPQPSLAGLPALIESVRAAGMDIEASVALGPISPATGLAAYRIVQEALSNAARHAAGVKVRVTVTLSESLHLVVRNAPNPVSQGAPGRDMDWPGCASARRCWAGL